MELVRYLALAVAALFVAGCAGTSAGDGSTRSQDSQTQTTQPAATPSPSSSVTSSPAPPSTFVGGEPDFVMLVRWEYLSESSIQGEMRKTAVEPTDPYGEGPRHPVL